ncbi:MAG TPA: tetratricopeptide repeat protein [Ramlibacter sp.]|nr:tetratricopeptide repeat protein [Ramlibacter sp.]
MGYFIDDLPSGAQAGPRRDARGCTTSTRSAAALSYVETALEKALSYAGDPLADLDQAAATDPGWAYPHVLKAGLLLTAGEYEPSRAAAAELELAQRLAGTADAREQAHLSAARAALAGEWDTACEAWERILVDHPLDVAALLFAHLFDFYRGDALNLRRRPERVLPQWSADLPLYGYVLGLYAFGLEESGHYGAAEDAGRAALEHNRRDTWAVHAVTHVFEMQGRHEAGTRWLTSRAPDWSIDNGFAFHNWFHAALFHLERMDTAAALAVYDSQLAPNTDLALQRVDGTAILWRLKLLGVDVADRFDALRRRWHDDAPAAGYYAFNDFHALVANVGAGDRAETQAACERLLAALTLPVAAGPSNRQMTAQVGLPLARAVMAYARGDHAAAAEGLLQVRDRAHGFGGSHAQRDILTLTLMDAAARAGEAALARHILQERRPAKGATPLTAWWQERIAKAAQDAVLG